MSDNRKRGTAAFPKYDTMTIGELEAVLREDAQSPDGDDSDAEEMLYVMEVLAKKRRQNGIAGKTALEAYEQFQQLVEKEHTDSAPAKQPIPIRRMAAMAASVVLIFTLAVSANAFDLRAIVDTVARWAQETFCFATEILVSEPDPSDFNGYTSLQDALSGHERDSSFVPSWIPEGYELVDIVIDRTPIQEVYFAVYSNGESRLKISVKSYLDTEPEQIEQSSNLLETYVVDDTAYYIFENNGQQMQAVWISDRYECYISGALSIDELRQMIDSIGKG